MPAAAQVHDAPDQRARPPLLTRRRLADLALFGVTVVELALLLATTRWFTFTDWIYVGQHLVVLAIAITRRAPRELDRSWRAALAVAVSYLYPYAQVLCLRHAPGLAVWPAGGFCLVTLGATLSLTSLIALGRRFGIRPALRGLVTRGPYRLVRHPMYLSYVIADIGYNLQEWSWATVLLVIAGWASLVYRIVAEERVLAADPEWMTYVAHVRSRIVPGVW
jgi:protein-S-isoprenylcysteine O-methyltransferase Ste14